MFVPLWRNIETILHSCTVICLSNLAKACCLRVFVAEGPKKNKGSESFAHCLIFR